MLFLSFRPPREALQIIFKSHRQAALQAANSTSSGQMDGDPPIDRNYFNNVLDGILSMHMMAFNEFGFVFDEFDSTDYPVLARCLFCTYMILVSILLVNMIIAMLGKTYQDIASQPNENLRQWARALLIVERMWTKEGRLKILDKYSQRPVGGSSSSSSSATDGRKFGLTWTLSVSILRGIVSALSCLPLSVNHVLIEPPIIGAPTEPEGERFPRHKALEATQSGQHEVRASEFEATSLSKRLPAFGLTLRTSCALRRELSLFFQVALELIKFPFGERHRCRRPVLS